MREDHEPATWRNTIAWDIVWRSVKIALTIVVSYLAIGAICNLSGVPWNVFFGVSFLVVFGGLMLLAGLAVIATAAR